MKASYFRDKKVILTCYIPNVSLLEDYLVINFCSNL